VGAAKEAGSQYLYGLALPPEWVDHNLSLTRAGFMRLIAQDPYVTQAEQRGTIYDLDLWPRVAGPGLHLELRDSGTLNARQRNRVVNNPPPWESLLSVAAWSLYEVVGTYYCLGTIEPIPGEEARFASGVLPLPKDIRAPGFEQMSMDTLVYLVNAEENGLTLVSDQSSQDQRYFRFKAELTLGTLERVVKSRWAHLPLTARSWIMAGIGVTLPKKIRCVEPPLIPEAAYSISTQDHGLRSGEPATKGADNLDTLRLNLATLALALEQCATPELRNAIMCTAVSYHLVEARADLPSTLRAQWPRWDDAGWWASVVKRYPMRMGRLTVARQSSPASTSTAMVWCGR